MAHALDSLAQDLVRQARSLDWCVRHELLNAYGRNATMRSLIQGLMAPDELLWGKSTGISRPLGAIALYNDVRFPGSSRPFKQRRLTEIWPQYRN